MGSQIGDRTRLVRAPSCNFSRVKYTRATRGTAPRHCRHRRRRKRSIDASPCLDIAGIRVKCSGLPRKRSGESINNARRAGDGKEASGSRAATPRRGLPSLILNIKDGSCLSMTGVKRSLLSAYFSLRTYVGLTCNFRRHYVSVLLANLTSRRISPIGR